MSFLSLHVVHGDKLTGCVVMQGVTDLFQEIKIVKLKISSKGLDKSGKEMDCKQC